MFLVADDLHRRRGERYGCVDRASPTTSAIEVNHIAIRLERFDHDAFARTKSWLDHVSVPAR